MYTVCKNRGVEMVLLKQLFGNDRIVGLSGEKSSGKSNNLIHLIKEYREHNSDVPIYLYGFNDSSMRYLKKYGNIHEISSISQLAKKKNCLIIVDEMQQLKINDRRYKDDLDQLIDFIYHNNCWIIFSSPNIREFNSIIGSKIERWALKTIRKDDCINGSHLKKVVEEYKGRYKSINSIIVPKNKIVVINEECELVIECDYIEEVDNKKENLSIF